MPGSSNVEILPFELTLITDWPLSHKATIDPLFRTLRAEGLLNPEFESIIFLYLLWRFSRIFWKVRSMLKQITCFIDGADKSCGG